MEPVSLVSMLEVHKVLQEQFLQHQEALLDADILQAAERLDAFAQGLARHIWAEETVLLPVFERAGAIPGGPPVLFTGEHKRLREWLDDFKACLTSLSQTPEDRKRGILWLLDREASFKNLMLHHDLREANIFYPALDRVTSAAERRDLLARCDAGPTS
jgi:hemerythrin-like domain-containing protein